jgi:hypothetical protein
MMRGHGCDGDELSDLGRRISCTIILLASRSLSFPRWTPLKSVKTLNGTRRRPRSCTLNRARGPPFLSQEDMYSTTSGMNIGRVGKPFQPWLGNSASG